MEALNSAWHNSQIPLGQEEDLPTRSAMATERM